MIPAARSATAAALASERTEPARGLLRRRGRRRRPGQDPDLAALLVDGHDGAPAGAAQPPRQRAQLIRRRDVVAEEDHTGRAPLAQRRADVGGRRGAGEAQHDQLPDLLAQREPVDRSARGPPGALAGGSAAAAGGPPRLAVRRTPRPRRSRARTRTAPRAAGCGGGGRWRRGGRARAEQTRLRRRGRAATRVATSRRYDVKSHGAAAGASERALGLVGHVAGDRERGGRGGEGALRTCSARSVCENAKSSTSRPSRATACARTPAQARSASPRLQLGHVAGRGARERGGGEGVVELGQPGAPPAPRHPPRARPAQGRAEARRREQRRRADQHVAADLAREVDAEERQARVGHRVDQPAHELAAVRQRAAGRRRGTGRSADRARRRPAPRAGPTRRRRRTPRSRRRARRASGAGRSGARAGAGGAPAPAAARCAGGRSPPSPPRAPRRPRPPRP